MAYIQSSSRSLQPPLTMLINFTANIILILAITGSMVVLTAGLLVHGFEVRPQSQHRPLSWSLHFDKPRYSFGSGTCTGTCTGTRTAESAKYPVCDQHQTRVRTCCFQNRLGRGLFMTAQVDPNDSISLDNHDRDDGDDQILDRSHDRVVAGTKIVLWRYVLKKEKEKGKYCGVCTLVLRTYIIDDLFDNITGKPRMGCYFIKCISCTKSL